MKFGVRIGVILVLASLTGLVYGQDVYYDYDRDANFSAYKTYEWSNAPTDVKNQLTDQNIRKAIDEQLALKGLTKVTGNANLLIRYRTFVRQEKSVDVWGTGPRWRTGTARVDTVTNQVGTLTVEIYDPARKQLVWSGNATKTLDVSSDPDKNYKKLQKAMKKLFNKYPPPVSKN